MNISIFTKTNKKQLSRSSAVCRMPNRALAVNSLIREEGKSKRLLSYIKVRYKEVS
jgi:hypothetical protein